jgi:hypothetical protein
MRSAFEPHVLENNRPLPRPEFELLSLGVVLVRWPLDAIVKEPDASAAISGIRELCGDGPRPLLVDMQGMRCASSGALTKFARCLPATRMALVGTSPVERTIVEFFRAIHRPSYPVSYFTQESKALEWLTNPGSPAANRLAGEDRAPAFGSAEGGARRPASALLTRNYQVEAQQPSTVSGAVSCLA